MKELLDKLSSYNLFNCLVPGVILAYMVDMLTTYKLIQSDVVVGVFLYYFLGLICSRFGSLIIQPILKYFKFVKFTPYSEFVEACEKDQKIDLLSEVSNMYRTFCAVFIMLGIAKLYEYFSLENPGLAYFASYLLIVGLFVLFLLSHRKQSEFITKRINITQKKSKADC